MLFHLSMGCYWDVLLMAPRRRRRRSGWQRWLVDYTAKCPAVEIRRFHDIWLLKLVQNWHDCHIYLVTLKPSITDTCNPQLCLPPDLLHTWKFIFHVPGVNSWELTFYIQALSFIRLKISGKKKTSLMVVRNQKVDFKYYGKNGF